MFLSCSFFHAFNFFFFVFLIKRDYGIQQFIRWRDRFFLLPIFMRFCCSLLLYIAGWYRKSWPKLYLNFMGLIDGTSNNRKYSLVYRFLFTYYYSLEFVNFSHHCSKPDNLCPVNDSHNRRCILAL